LATTYQFGEVDPTLSVAYRFLIAAIILFSYCKIKNYPYVYRNIFTSKWPR
jgi:hypothetical protein